MGSICDSSGASRFMKAMRLQQPMQIAFFAFCGSVFSVLLLAFLNSLWWSAALAVGIVILYLYIFRRRIHLHPTDLFEADTLYLLLFAAYVILMPLFYLATADDKQRLTLELKVVCCVGIALVGLKLGFSSSLGNGLERVLRSVDGNWRKKEARRIAIFLIVLGVALVAILVSQVGLATYTQSDYVESYGAEQGMGALAAGAILVQMGLFVLFLAYAQPGRPVGWWFLALFSLLSAAIFLTGRRRLVAESAIPLLAFHHFYVRRFRPRQLLVGAGLGLALLIFVGQFRNFMQENLRAMVSSSVHSLTPEALLVSFDELNAVHRSLSETIQTVPYVRPYRYGKTYVEGFEILIPQVLYPQRPLPPNSEMAWDIDPKIAKAGGGFGFSPFAEGYLNFGFLGVFATGYLEGVFISALMKFRRSKPDSKGRLLLYGVGLTPLFLLFRGDFAGLLEEDFVIAGLPALAIAAWLGRRRFTVP
jgi:oligosaccharide repeat unit polymerase